MVIPQGSLLLTIILGLSAVAHAQQPMDDVAVGQEICTAGYVMDESCIVRQTIHSSSLELTFMEYCLYCINFDGSSFFTLLSFYTEIKSIMATHTHTLSLLLL